MIAFIFSVARWFSYVASIAAIEQIHSSNQTVSRTSISILVALRLLPNALFSNIGGVLADSYDRRNIMLILDILGAFIACFFLLAYQFKSIPALYAATFCQMTVAAIYEPCRSALVPMLITNEGYLKKALTLTGLTWSVMASVGASTGGLATESFGIDTCFCIDSVTYLLSAGFLWKIRGKYVAVGAESDDELVSTVPSSEEMGLPFIDIDIKPHILSLAGMTNMIVNGLSYLRSKQWGAFVFLKGCAALIYGAADVLNVAFSEMGSTSDSTSRDANLEGSSERLGILFASVGVGCFLGPVLVESFTDMEKPSSLEGACLVSYLLMAIGCWGLAQINGFISICCYTAIRSAGSSVIWIHSSLLLQKFCENNMLGRVMAVDYALATLCEAISAMCGGLLQDKAGWSPESVSYTMSMVALSTLVLWARYFFGVRL
ncbi:hypothetical protein ACHAWX_007563 [Stephanocyclus meneghinianus]